MAGACAIKCGIMHRAPLTAVTHRRCQFYQMSNTSVQLRWNRRSSVEEDELGVLREIGRRDYVTCSRCGMPVARSAAAVLPGEALEDHSEYRYLCPDCQKALADGEVDLPTTNE